ALSKLDNEMIRTIEVFFKCGLNLSEAAKELYIHRNTLIYRLDKIQKITSYDIREFNNAMIFKIIFLYNKKKKII
ncbi:CdaR family transcriptional regulator, partial [uncultured Clostridium sp.]